MSAEPNTKQCPVPGGPREVPRDPGAYTPTIHFGQRLRSRVPKPMRSRVVRTCIEEGHCFARDQAGDEDAERIHQAYGFEADIEGVTYCVVVGIVTEAYHSESTKHLAMTVFPVEEGQ